MSNRGIGASDFPLNLCKVGYPLRAYQRQVVVDALSLLTTGRSRVVIHLPTGAGKTRVASSLVSRLAVASPKRNGVFVWLASAEELCDQAMRSLREAWSFLGDQDLPVDSFAGGARDSLQGVPSGFLVCSLGKLWAVIKRGKGDLAAFAPRVSGVVFDEAHQAVARTYESVTSLLASWSVPVVGLTATPGRHSLHPEESEKLAEFFERRKVTIKTEGDVDPIEYLVREGYLSRAIVESIELNEMAPEVPKGVDDLDRAYGEKLGKTEGWLDALRAAIDDGLRRCRRIIVFAPSVASAVSLADLYGETAKVVVGTTRSENREEAVRWFCESALGPDDRRLLFNYDVFTAGFDAPKTDAVVIGQPTRSVVRYSQMVGRGLRGEKSGGTRECRVYTVTDSRLRGFRTPADAFTHWEDLWQ